eukprot:scaffold220511_cov35-Tisochrysis_lutea.AAC.2
MRELKVLVFKFIAIDRLASRSNTIGKIAPLAHELRDDSVESRSLVVQRLSRHPLRVDMKEAVRQSKRPRAKAARWHAN